MNKRDTTKATLLIMALFFLQPMAFGAWLAMIPYIKDTLALSKSDLAIALLGMPLALVPALQVASRIVASIGPRKTFAIMLPIQTVFVLLPFLATGVWSLFAALACVGVIIGFLEVALNTYAGRLEKSQSLYIMSRCHGFWALGVGAGSLVVTQLFWIGPITAVLLICAVSAFLGVVSGLSLPKLVGQDDGPRPTPQKIKDMPKALFVISLFVLTVSLAEGAMSDWSAVYLAERWNSGPEEAGIAVTIFAAFLAGGRFVGDWLMKRMGQRRAARFTVLLALTGVIVLTVPTPVQFVFVGVALIGLGVSIAFPLGISAAAALDDTHEAQNIATMSMIAISSFLIGPPIIGLVAEAATLQFALMLLLPCLLLSLLLSRIFEK